MYSVSSLRHLGPTPARPTRGKHLALEMNCVGICESEGYALCLTAGVNRHWRPTMHPRPHL